MRVVYNVKEGTVTVNHDGNPPCLYCGELVIRDSMDGPGVCEWCDMGKHRDGRDWTYCEMVAFFKTGRERIERWRDAKAKETSA